MAQHAWFWDPLLMSCPIPWYLSNLLSQPFNQTPHRNLSKLDLHALLLEPLQSRSRVSSKAVAVGIEAPQRGSTRSVIADNWVIQSIHHNENLAHLLGQFTETDLRVGGASPPGTSPWCCTNWQGSIRTP